jgi:hypothetical protein
MIIIYHVKDKKELIYVHDWQLHPSITETSRKNDVSKVMRRHSNRCFQIQMSTYFSFIYGQDEFRKKNFFNNSQSRVSPRSNMLC